MISRRESSSSKAISVARYLRRSAVLLVVSVLIVGSVGIAGLATAWNTSNRVNTRITPLRSANRSLLLAQLDAETSVRGYLTVGNDQFLAPYRQAEQDFPAALRTAIRLDGGTAITEWLDRQGQLFDAWRTTVAEATIAARRAGAPLSGQVALLDRGKHLVDQFRQANTAANDQIVARRDHELRNIDRVAWGSGALVLIMVVAICWGSVRRSRFTQGTLIGPLAGIGSTISLLQAGDRGARAEVAGSIETREVAVALNRLAEESERLEAVMADRLQREQLMRHMATRLRSTLDTSRVLDLAVREVGLATRADRASIVVLDAAEHPSRLAEWHKGGLSPFGLGPVTPGALTPAAVRQLFASDQTVVVDDLGPADGLAPDIRTRFEARGTAAAMIVPFGAADDQASLLVVERLVPPRPWVPAEVQIAEAIAAEVDGAMLNASLYERERSLVAQLRELDQAKTDFVSTVSHELRTPMTSIMGYVEMLRDGDAGELDPEQDAMVAVVERSAQRLLALIEDLLTLSRVEAGAFRLHVETVDPREVIERVEATMQPIAERHHLDFVVDVDPDITEITIDRDQFERALLNLLSNAMKFTPSAGTVALRAGPTMAGSAVEGITVEVSDTGIGIPEAEQGRLFTRFFRSSNAQEQAIGGTGLGLTITRTIIEHHGGSISFVSAPGRGTTFSFTLPSRPTEAEASGAHP